MCFEMGSINHQSSCRPIPLHKFSKDFVENTQSVPSDKAIIGSFVWSILRWNIFLFAGEIKKFLHCVLRKTTISTFLEGWHLTSSEPRQVLRMMFSAASMMLPEVYRWDISMEKVVKPPRKLAPSRL